MGESFSARANSASAAFPHLGSGSFGFSNTGVQEAKQVVGRSWARGWHLRGDGGGDDAMTKTYRKHETYYQNRSSLLWKNMEISKRRK